MARRGVVTATGGLSTFNFSWPHLTSNQRLTLSPTLRLSHDLHKLANVSHHSIHSICCMDGHIALPENWNDMKGLLGASGKAASPVFSYTQTENCKDIIVVGNHLSTMGYGDC